VRIICDSSWDFGWVSPMRRDFLDPQSWHFQVHCATHPVSRISRVVSTLRSIVGMRVSTGKLARVSSKAPPFLVGRLPRSGRSYWHVRSSDLARTADDQMARGLFRPSQARLVAGRLPLMSFADGALPVATTPRSGVITGQGVVVAVVGYCNCA